jgi:hypothetical protein
MLYQFTMATTAGVILAGIPGLAAASGSITIPVTIRDCSSCMVYAGTADYSFPYRHWDQTIRLRNGTGALNVPTWVTSFQIGVQKGTWSGPGTQSQIVIQYLGETAGLPVSARRARTSHAGYMCIAPTPDLRIAARAVLRKTIRYKGWRQDRLFDRKEVLVWATPTLQGRPTYRSDGPLATQRGLIGVQNTVCGAKYN